MGELGDMVPAPDLDGKPARILIVEDEPLVRLTLAENLRDAGFSVVEAANAEEALVYIGAASPVDLVLSDVQMPGEMDGIALARQIKTLHPALPVILTSGNLDWGNILGPGLFIQKPYRHEQVIALMVQTLGLRQSNEPDE
jgi:CheY-like chemotaxis protein